MATNFIDQYIKDKYHIKGRILDQNKKLVAYEINDESFAYVESGKHFLRLSLRSEEHLAKLLKEEYDEVLDGYKLNRRKWISIIVSGQLTNDEIFGLIDLSYNLTTQETTN